MIHYSLKIPAIYEFFNFNGLSKITLLIIWYGKCFAACKAAKHLPTNANVVVLSPKSVRNYLSKFVDVNWIRDNGFAISG